jgi:precorrin-2 dehydrogenase / sirohydrochlorin ferrochelatase
MMGDFPLYPLMVRLENRRCVVIGGGSVAARKVRVLIDCGAMVTVIAPDICDEIVRLDAPSRLVLEKRDYCSGDLQGAVLVVAATDDPAVNMAVREESQRIGVLLNVVDVPELCDFHVPSVIRRDPLTITVSTQGKAPGASREVRRLLEKVVDETWAEYVRIVADMRVLIRDTYPDDIDARRKVMKRLLDLDLPQLIKTRGPAGAREEAMQCLS